jgi:hypothetical protein
MVLLDTALLNAKFVRKCHRGETRIVFLTKSGCLWQFEMDFH